MRNQRGMTLVMAMALMLVLGILGYALVQVGQYETRFMVKGKKSDAAFYLANAGVEWAMHELKSDSSYTGTDTAESLGDGEFEVSVTDLGDDTYEITSTGYIPDQTNPKEKRTIKAKVIRDMVDPGEDHATCFAGAQKIDIGSDTHFRGSLRCNEEIKVTGTGKLWMHRHPVIGKGDVLSHTDISVALNAKINMDSDSTDPGDAVRARGTITYPVGGIVNAEHIVPGDDTADTDYMNFTCPVDTTVLLADKVTHTQTSWNQEFNLSSGTTHVQYFPGGITFNSNTVFVGTGTIVAPGGGTGITFNCNIGSYNVVNAFNSTFCRMNIFILGGTSAQNVDFHGDKTALWGYVWCGKKLKMKSGNKLSHKGAMGSWASASWALEIDDSCHFQWAGWAPDNAPPGVEVEIKITKWEEITT